MKKQNKSKKKTVDVRNTSDKSVAPASGISSFLENQFNENQNEKPVSEVEGIGNEKVPSCSTPPSYNETEQLKDENMYLKLLLGTSHRVDQLFEELKKNFSTSDALSSAESFKRCLGELDKDRETEIFVQSFQYFLNISNYLSQHKNRVADGETSSNMGKVGNHYQEDTGKETDPDSADASCHLLSPADENRQNESLNDSMKDPTWTPPRSVGGLQIVPVLNSENLTPISQLGLKLSDKVPD